jgi:hypothetical protein
MRRKTRDTVARDIARISRNLNDIAETVDKALPPDLEQITIGYQVDGRVVVMIDDSYKFVIPEDRSKILEIVNRLAWALVETSSDSELNDIRRQLRDMFERNKGSRLR